MKKFFVRRVMRIFPAYLLVAIPLMTVAFATGIGAPEATPLDARLALSNILLLPRDDLTSFVPVVSWTLTHELMFYLLFSLTFLSFRLALSALAAWSALCLLAFGAGISPPGWSMQLSALNIYFLAGVLTYHASARFHGSRWMTGALSVAVLGLAAAFESRTILVGEAQPVVQAVCYGLAFTLLIFSVARLAYRKGLAASILDPLGRQSYSIYLVHYPIIVVIAMILTAMQVPAPLLLAFGLSVGGTLAVSWVVFRLVERPAIDLGRRLTRRMTPVRPSLEPAPEPR